MEEVAIRMACLLSKYKIVLKIVKLKVYVPVVVVAAVELMEFAHRYDDASDIYILDRKNGQIRACKANVTMIPTETNSKKLMPIRNSLLLDA